MIFDKDLVGKKQSVVDEFLLLSPHTTPLLSLVGFSEPVHQTTHTWYEDTVIPYEGVASETIEEAATTIKVENTEAFASGHVVKLGEEMVRVNSVDAAGKQLTVTRGYADTKPGVYEKGARIEVMFREGEEGGEFVKSRKHARKPVSNVTQIFSESIEISGSAAEVSQHGIADLYENEKQMKQAELALQLEKMMINGMMFDNGIIRQAKGIRQFIGNVADANGEVLTIDHINDMAQELYGKGAFKNGGRFILMTGAKQKRAMGRIDSVKVEIPHGANTRGEVVDGIVTDFGTFPVVLNNNLQADEVLLIDIDRIKIRPLGQRSFGHIYHGVQSDAIKGTIIGEYTLELKQGDAMGRIKNLG